MNPAEHYTPSIYLLSDGRKQAIADYTAHLWSLEAALGITEDDALFVLDALFSNKELEQC